MKGVSGNGSYPKRGDGQQSGYVDTGKMTCRKWSGDYHKLKGYVTGKTGNY
jgi:hypothetical protein